MTFKSNIVNNTRGNSLLIVLLFSIIGLTIVLTYISNQLIIAKPSLNSLSSVQALFNARSGIYKAFDIISRDTSLTDTLKEISLQDPLFGEDLFDTAEPDDKFSGTPTELNLFKNDSFGNCEITLIPYGSFYKLTSTGKFQNGERKVITTLGGKNPALPDTVLIIYNEHPWEGAEPLGTRVMRKAQNSTKSSELLESLLADYESMLQVFDTALLDPPLTISSTNEIEKITDTINGSLLINGNYMDIQWKEERTIIILGDLQITGEVSITNVSFVVAGEIKLFDKTTIENSSLFSKSRIFIGDFAQFHGDAIALHSITVYNDATVVNKSTLVVAGSTSDTNNDSTSVAVSKDSIKYVLFIEDNASVDAVCIALGSPGTIRTGTETTIAGILWAQNSVFHQGSMSGLIRAGRMVDGSIPVALTPPPSSTTTKRRDTRERKPPPIMITNAMSGSLTQLSTITEYRVPCFTEEFAIIGWNEE